MLLRMQTDMGTQDAPRPAEDGAKAISWAYTSSKARLLRPHPHTARTFAAGAASGNAVSLHVQRSICASALAMRHALRALLVRVCMPHQ